MDHREVITIGPGKRRGELRIGGARMSVTGVPECRAGGMTEEEILEDFPGPAPKTCRLSARGRRPVVPTNILP